MSVTAEDLNLVVKQGGPSKTTNLLLIAIGVLAIAGAGVFIWWVSQNNECETNADCKDGVCSDLKCVECVKTVDCKQGFQCKEKKCVEIPPPPPDCSADTDCTGDRAKCEAGKCVCTEASCKAKGEQFVCDAVSKACVDTTPRECVSSRDCPAYKQCGDEGKCKTSAGAVIGTVLGVLALVALGFVAYKKLRPRGSLEEEREDFFSLIKDIGEAAKHHIPSELRENTMRSLGYKKGPERELLDDYFEKASNLVKNIDMTLKKKKEMNRNNHKDLMNQLRGMKQGRITGEQAASGVGFAARDTGDFI